MGEFDLIARYFKRPARHAAVGVGDDCALLQPAPGTQLAISCDMLVQGRHFFADVNPRSLGHKALAVNLSDLAACGAKPLAFTLALALPDVNEPWLAEFARGLFELADAFDCELIGGDTTCGPLNICITVFGEVPVVNGRSLALLRSGAIAGDDLYVSGSLGDARLALEVRQGTLTVPDDVLIAAR
ncbi:MAG TPA: AIR synthase related protein, partial [Rhodoferax sp.]|nr:AIR synthase related protein [Rhodoferax sp.]